MFTIYSKKYCPWCDKAKILLQRAGESFTEIDCTSSNEPRQHLLDEGKITVPQIFLGDTYIGGYEDLFNLSNKEG